MKQQKLHSGYTTMSDKQESQLWYAAYDFSNSGYVLMFQSFLFPLVLLAASPYPEAQAQAIWAWLVSVSSISAIIAAPFIGRLADHVGKAAIFVFLVVITGVLASFSPLALAKYFIPLAATFIVFNVLFELSQSLYDSFLLNFRSSRKEVTSLSSFAWGFGYLGGALFAILYLGLSKAGVSAHVSLSILGVIYLLLSIPAMISFRRVDRTVRYGHRPKMREILRTSSPIPWRELLIYWVIADSVAAVLYFAPLYIRQDIGLSTQMLGGLFLGAQLLAFPITILMGMLANRWGAMRVIRWCLLIWVGAVIGLYLARSLREVIIVMAIFSFVIGSTQAILRAHYASRIRVDKSGEGLGYYAIAQKSASVIAPMIVGAIILISGSIRPAFLVLAAFLIVAFLFAFRLPEAPASKEQTSL